MPIVKTKLENRCFNCEGSGCIPLIKGQNKGLQRCPTCKGSGKIIELINLYIARKNSGNTK